MLLLYDHERVSYLSLSGFPRDCYKFLHQFHRAFCPLCLKVRSIPPNCSFWYSKCIFSGASLSTGLRVVCELCGFVQAKCCLLALNLGFLLMIAHPASRCVRHCFFLQCCQVFLILLMVPVLLGGL